MKKLTLKRLDTLPYGAQESLNRLRVNLGFCGKEYKKIIVTSSTPGEGKSFVSVNLWRMLAEAGHKVVLVDADIRKSMMRSRHQIVGGEENYIGITFYLSGQAEMEDILYETNVENGYMVPVAYTVSNPAILLQNERFPKLLDYLAERFDYVLVDTPPLTNVADGDLIASHCDGALLVVRSGVTPRQLIATSIKQLERANCKLMGIALNRVDVKKDARYSKYSKYGYYYSSYGYGSDSGSDKRSRKGGKHVAEEASTPKES